VTVAPTPDFFRWSFAQHVDAGAFGRERRARTTTSRRGPAWLPDRRQDHLRDLNTPTSGPTSDARGLPGHFLHFQHLRHVESKARKSLMLGLGGVRGRLGALSTHDDRGGLEKQDPDGPSGATRRGAHSHRPARGGHPPPRRGHVVSRACGFSRRSVPRGRRTAGARPSAAPSTRATCVHRGQADLLKLREDYRAQAGDAFSSSVP